MSLYCRAEQVFAAIDNEHPTLTGSELARIINRDESNVRRMRRQKNLTLWNADRILSELGLSHLLSSGEIEVIELPQGNGYTTKPLTKYEKLRLENLELRRRIKQLEGYRKAT